MEGELLGEKVVGELLDAGSKVYQSVEEDEKVRSKKVRFFVVKEKEGRTEVIPQEL